MTSILVVTTAFPRTVDDHAGRFVLEWSRALTAEGITARVLAPPGWTPPDLKMHRFSDSGDLLGGSGVPEALTRHPIRTLRAGLRTTWSLRRALRQIHRSDEQIVAHWLIPAGLLAIERTQDAVLIAHGGDVDLLCRVPGGRQLARRLDAHAALIIFVSDQLRARFAQLLGRPPRSPHPVCPMGVAEPCPDPVATQKFRDLAAGRLIVATVGRLVPIKGLDTIPAALQGHDVLWIALGEGFERDRLSTLAVQHGVAWHAPGSVGPAIRDALLSVADLFIQPSRSIAGRTEGTPVALLEALNAGVPTIATTTGGIAAAAQPAGAVLIPPDDIGRLRDAVDQVLSDPAIRQNMAQRHRQWAVRYRWSSLGVEHAALIRRARRPRP